VSFSFVHKPIHPGAERFYVRRTTVDSLGRTRTWPSVADLVWPHVNVSAGLDGCWPWTTGTTKQGYGQVSAGGRNFSVHRAVYEMLIGPIPDDHLLDHLCHSRSTGCVAGPRCPHRRCANPFDLEPVTPLENARRAAALIITCTNGHPYTPDKTGRTAAGYRRCKECNRLGMQERYQPKPRKATPDVLTRIAELRHEGLSTAQIGRVVNLSQPYISRLLRRIESEGSRP
jgi:hypothetical protein